MSSLGRYLHTVRYLRSGQLVARLALHLPRRPLPVLAPLTRRPRTGRFTAPVATAPSLVAADVFRFLSLERPCREAADWRAAGAERLWAYNLHYFDDLNAHDSAARRAWHLRLIERWIGENPPGARPGWEPYPVSRRIANWIKWDLRCGALPETARASLASQARWLAGHLEYHLLGNHLLANAKALVHAGLYFTGREAEAWLATGMRIIDRQLPEQVLADGGHFERSPMYHAGVLEDLLDLINVLRAYSTPVPTEWTPAAVGMNRWLQIMSHPDGGIAFFNDCALGIAPTAEELREFAGRLGIALVPDSCEALTVLQPSGYVRALAGPAWLLCDCAPVGPDYQPGHAHADTLSFELSLRGRRLFVNTGTSQYGLGAQRQRERGTGAHNTIDIDGQDSSEVWAGFRVARRARVRLVSARTPPTTIHAVHDGYRRLAGRNEHSRCWRLDARGLDIDDQVSGSFRQAHAHFHLHPDISVEQVGAQQLRLHDAAGVETRVNFEGAASVEVLVDNWHPRFGVAIRNQSLRVRLNGCVLRTGIRWETLACDY